MTQGGQVRVTAWCAHLTTVHPDDLSSRILAYAERYESRDEPIPYTLINEFEYQRDISSINGSTEASTETRVEGTDYQIYPSQPLASYPMQEARGGQITSLVLSSSARPPQCDRRMIELCILGLKDRRG